MTNLSTLKNALQAFDYNHMTPYAVGFDRTFDRLFDYVTHQAESTGFPPYNIQKTEDYKFVIEIFVALVSVKKILKWKLQKVFSQLNQSKIKILVQLMSILFTKVSRRETLQESLHLQMIS